MSIWDKIEPFRTFRNLRRVRKALSMTGPNQVEALKENAKFLEESDPEFRNLWYYGNTKGEQGENITKYLDECGYYDDEDLEE